MSVRIVSFQKVFLFHGSEKLISQQMLVFLTVQISHWTIQREYVFGELSLSAVPQESVFSFSKEGVKRARGLVIIILRRQQLFFGGN